MPIITESDGCAHCLIEPITNRNGSFTRESLERQWQSCYKAIVCPGASRALPPEGSSFGSRWLP